MNLIIPVNAEQLIKDEIKSRTMSTMVALVERGYVIAKQATRHMSFLDWELGIRHEGYLRQLAINYLFKKEVDRGGLPFSVSLEHNRNKSHRFLLFGNGNIKMTISQVASPKLIARKAFFRDKLQYVNQIAFNFSGEDTSLSTKKDYYLLLTYSSGGDKPRFVNLGIPNGTHWEGKINLLNETRLVVNDKEHLDKEEVIDEELFFELRKFSEEVEGNGGH